MLLNTGKPVSSDTPALWHPAPELGSNAPQEQASGNARGRLRPRNLAHTIVEALTRAIEEGRLRPGDKLPPEAAVMAEFGVSRTVVREALSMLQASHLVVTRHGIGTFVAEQPEPGSGFRISGEQLETLHDVIALLELRIAIESETASLAAQRHRPENLRAIRAALDAMERAISAGEPAAEQDLRFHIEIARATQNAHFAGLMQSLGVSAIPRARLAAQQLAEGTPQEPYLRLVLAEHEAIYSAIAERDAETARSMMRLHLSNGRDRRRRAAALAESQSAAEPDAVRPLPSVGGSGSA
jgi:GntR family transcriptional regulator, transcriptional repressor for pyruvate dehydrogenase complex